MMPVCGNTLMMLKDTRFKNNFEFYGDFNTHYGIYEGCGEGCPFDANSGESESCCWDFKWTFNSLTIIFLLS